MSSRNGHRSQFNVQRKAKALRRLKSRALRASLKKTAAK